MEWVYSKTPPNKRLLTYLEKKVGEKELARKTERLLNLYTFLTSRQWKSANEIRHSVFLDSAEKKPVFSERTAKAVFRLLQQSGGSPEAQLFDKGIRSVLSYAGSWLPDPVSNFTQNVYPYVTVLKTLQDNPFFGPYVDIGKEIAVQGSKTGIIAADTIGAEVGGPIGTAAVAIPAALAGLFVVLTHILEDELGEAMLAAFLILPFVGPVLYKAAGSLGKVAKKVSDRRDDIAMFPIVGQTVSDYIPVLDEEGETAKPSGETGGKRFSTRKHKKYKWRKTIRKRSAKP